MIIIVSMIAIFMYKICLHIYFAGSEAMLSKSKIIKYAVVMVTVLLLIIQQQVKQNFVGISLIRRMPVEPIRNFTKQNTDLSVVNKTINKINNTYKIFSITEPKHWVPDWIQETDIEKLLIQRRERVEKR